MEHTITHEREVIRFGVDAMAHRIATYDMTDATPVQPGDNVPPIRRSNIGIHQCAPANLGTPFTLVEVSWETADGKWKSKWFGPYESDKSNDDWYEVEIAIVEGYTEGANETNDRWFKLGATMAQYVKEQQLA